jgi:Xaa-Pro dipeptidase
MNPDALRCNVKFMSRLRRLIEAEHLATELFQRAVAEGLLDPGSTELTASDGIKELATKEFGVENFWHKRIVRSGNNTVHPYRENPEVLTIQADDIIFLDFGPVFADWEADFGRTYVNGTDPAKLRLRDEAERIWNLGRNFAVQNPSINGHELYAYIANEVRLSGYVLGEQRHVGHLIGEFPHERVEDDKTTSYLTPDNTLSLQRTDAEGNQWHWILECHLVDPELNIGSFFEQLLV